MENIKGINLIIVDTVGSKYRLELKNNVKDINNKMIEIFTTLRKLNKKGINILLTNQVYRNFNDNKLENVGGKIVRNFSKVIIILEKNPRKLIKEKPSRIDYEFEIKNDGILLK